MKITSRKKYDLVCSRLREVFNAKKGSSEYKELIVLSALIGDFEDRTSVPLVQVTDEDIAEHLAEQGCNELNT